MRRMLFCITQFGFNLMRIVFAGSMWQKKAKSKRQSKIKFADRRTELAVLPLNLCVCEPSGFGFFTLFRMTAKIAEQVRNDGSGHSEQREESTNKKGVPSCPEPPSLLTIHS
jgi:hypothetical protein